MINQRVSALMAVLAVLSLSALSAMSAQAAQTAQTALALRDGQRFDPAATMTERAESAPEQLDLMTWMVGHWDVTLTRHVAADSLYTAAGRADITFMNRGHSFMERFHCENFDGGGHELNTLGFLVYNTSSAGWGFGVADSWRENITIYNGDFVGEDLVLTDARRLRGGLSLTHYRLTFSRESDDAFTLTLATATDGGDFSATMTRTYRRSERDDGMFTGATGYGTAAEDLPPEARQFDFLLGDWDLAHDMTFPNGQQAQWPARGTAVRMMNGYAVVEYSSYDVDPRLPDAATTIVRLYNRQMRRWESMYSTNRFNGILHFGGRLEDDRIVLHNFGADSADVPISQWVFQSWQDDSYSWYANVSRDRGATWQKTWLIDAKRRQ